MQINKLIKDEKFFAAAALFASVAPESIAHYLQACSLVHIKAGEVLLTPNTENAFLYVIVEGFLEIRLDSPEQNPLTLASRGDSVGEMSVIERRTPSAFVVATADSTVLAISHDVLWAMVSASHAIARNLLVILSGRIRSDNELISDSVVIIRDFEKKSYTDSLTGLHNRRWMSEFFARELERCQKDGVQAVLAVIDIDHFRAFNNNFGHLVGDYALNAVTDTLTRHFRAEDMLARFGGDEFVVLLPGTSLDEARQISERVHLAMKLAGKKLNALVSDDTAITVSIGIAAMDPGNTLEQLVNKADEALYRAKKKGRDQVSD